jgi:hypothetical protein
MKILIAGNWRWHHYEQAFADALTEFGHQIVPFSLSKCVAFSRSGFVEIEQRIHQEGA